MPIKTRSVSWGASPSPDVASYNVYWKKDAQPALSDPKVNVGKVLSIDLPDDLPGSEDWYGNYTIGVTAVDQTGNESNTMSYGTSFFDFVAPSAPGPVVIS
jgi:hypothetical protein